MRTLNPRQRVRAAVFAVALVAVALPAHAQRPARPSRPRTFDSVGVRGFVNVGNITFAAKDSFKAVLGSSSGVIVGGGGQALLPWGIYVEVSASQFKRTGERVFVGPNDEVFNLGIPLEVTITPVEVTGGWRYRRESRATPLSPFSRLSRFVAYGGAGFSSYGYRETADFARSGDNINERFSGFHVIGGAEYLVLPWLGVGGEVAWSSIAKALGKGGISAEFDEDNLGGTSARLKISIGR